MTALRRSLAALGLALAIVVASGGAAYADHIRVLAEMTTSNAAKAEQGYVLTVKMRTSDGRPLNEATIRIYEMVDLFGKRDMLIATLKTDGQGAGSAIYLPATPGRHEIIVRFDGRGHVPAFETRHVLEATVAAPAYRSATPPLAEFSSRVPYGVGVVVLSVWALIAFALFGTALGIRRGARDQHHIA